MMVLFQWADSFKPSSSSIWIRNFALPIEFLFFFLFGRVQIRHQIGQKVHSIFSFFGRNQQMKPWWLMPARFYIMELNVANMSNCISPLYVTICQHFEPIFYFMCADREVTSYSPKLYHHLLFFGE